MNGLKQFCVVFIFLSILKSVVPNFINKTGIIGEFWDGANFCGKKIELYENERIQFLYNWDNKISSFKIYKAVLGFDLPFGEGDRVLLEPGEYPSGVKLWCNRISSLFDPKTFDNLIAVLYEHSDFKGSKITIARGERLQYLFCWANRISSIVLSGNIRGCDCAFGEGICRSYFNCEYNCNKRTDNTSLLYDLSQFDNRIGSLYDEDNDEIVGTFYEHPNFCGRSIKIYKKERLHSLPHFDNIISSYKVLKPIVICLESFHGGQCITLKPDDRGELCFPFNDCVSSIYDEL